jgi:hypothetical protein
MNIIRPKAATINPAKTTLFPKKCYLSDSLTDYISKAKAIAAPER